MTKERLEQLGPTWRAYKKYQEHRTLPIDLTKEYGLDQEQTEYLEDLIDWYNEPDCDSLYHSDHDPVRAMALDECLTEAQHQGLDGWSDGEKVIITRFIQDLGKAVKVTMDTYK